MINIPCESDALKSTCILVYLPKKDTKKKDFQSILTNLPKKRYQKEFQRLKM